MKLNFVNYLAKLNKILFNLEREKIILYNRQNEMSKISKRNVQKKEKRPS